ncbi:hypothetical protein FH972_002381 [Carpinus fangiana]|uniref:Uncharacterized protein n=1 Tax=Carpinus fangiana TaxID=176857 RepID=A0A5N6QF17_9ROSI|nr:hypothetical protein FH972_002381 [Carpinus fangiana]
MRLLINVLAFTTVLFLMSMHAYTACRILHGEEQKLMNKNLLLGSLQKGLKPPSVPNPITNSASTINSRAFASHNFAPLMGSLQRGPVSPSAPNPGTHIPASTLGQRAFVGHNLLGSVLQKGPVPPSAPNPGTHIPASMVGQRALAGQNMVPSLLSSLRSSVPPSGPNPKFP